MLCSKSKAYRTLKGEEKRLAQKTLRNFVRSGMALPAVKRKQLLKLQNQLTQIESSFGKNLAEYEDYIEVPKNQTQGLSKAFLETLPATEKGYKVTLAYPHSIPFVKNSANEKLRKKLEEKLAKKGGKQNLRLFSKAIVLRQKIATLLSYKNYAQYVLEERMAKSPSTVKKIPNKDSKIFARPIKKRPN